MKKFILSAFMLASIFASSAEWISQSQAEIIAKKAFSSNTVLSGKSRGSDIKLRRQILSARGVPSVYLFDSQATNEFVVVAGDDDVVNPVLGYGTNDIDSAELPPALNYWLSQYASQIDWIATHRQNCKSDPQPNSTIGEVEPLLGDLGWNQGSPFNLLCPEKNGKRCVTGCVATSTAQAMRYWKYPSQGIGSWSYTWNDSTLSVDYSSATYDWDNMPYKPNSTTTQAQLNAIAELMKDVGVGVCMSYGTSESGAMTQATIYTLVENFGYDKGIKLQEREFFGIDLWETTLRDELKAGRPVIYAGQSSEGGHQFVCDGFNEEGYFHFNWGWGGYCNGYFLTTALVPQGVGIGGFAEGYNYNQSIITGMQPSAGNSSSYAFTPFGRYFTATDSKNYTAYIEGYSFVQGGATIEMGFYVSDDKVLNVDNSRVYKFSTQTLSPKIPGRNSGQIYAVDITSGNITFDPISTFDLSDGTYYITPVYRPEGTDQWTIVPSGLTQWVTLSVKEGLGEIVSRQQTAITVTSLDIPDGIKQGHTADIVGTLRAENGEFYNTVSLMINGQSGDTIAVAGTQLLDVPAGDIADFSLSVQIPCTTTPGTYYAQLYVAGNPLGSPLDVNVISGEVALNSENFPDKGLLSAVSAFDTDSNGILTASELQNIQTLNAMSLGITNAKGIDNLYALQQLYLDGNELTDIDVTPLMDLQVLGLDDNMLTELNVADNSNLKYLRCADNHIMMLNVTPLTMLRTLIITNNPMPAIQLGLNAALNVFTSDSQLAVNVDDNNSIDLSVAYPQIELDHITELSGATLDGSILTFDKNNDTATYKYDTGNTVMPLMPVTMVALKSSSVITPDLTAVSVHTSDGVITINGDFNNVKLYDMYGRTLYSGSESRMSVSTGIYIVNVDGQTFKVAIR